MPAKPVRSSFAGSLSGGLILYLPERSFFPAIHLDAGGAIGFVMLGSNVSAQPPRIFMHPFAVPVPMAYSVAVDSLAVA